jgi:hypothetical protein
VVLPDTHRPALPILTDELVERFGVDLLHKRLNNRGKFSTVCVKRKGVSHDEHETPDEQVGKKIR